MLAHVAVTLAEVHSFKRAPVECLDRLARLDGEPVGCAVATIRPEIAYVLPTVVRGHRRRGGGTRVYEVVPPWARERGPDVIEVPALDNDPESLAYALKRGFAGIGRERRVVLYLSRTGPPPVDPPEGVEIVTRAERPSSLAGCTRSPARASPRRSHSRPHGRRLRPTTSPRSSASGADTVSPGR